MKTVVSFGVTTEGAMFSELTCVSGNEVKGLNIDLAIVNFYEFFFEVFALSVCIRF